METEHKLSQVKAYVDTLEGEKEKTAETNFSLQDSVSKTK